MAEGGGALACRVPPDQLNAHPERPVRRGFRGGHGRLRPALKWQRTAPGARTLVVALRQPASDSNRRRLDAFPPHLPAENYVFHVTSDGVRPDGTCSQTLQIAGVRVDAAKVDKVAKRLHGVLLDLPRLCNVMLDPRWHAAQRPDAKSATIARAAGGVPVRRKLQLRAPRGSNRYFVLKTVFKARWGHGRTAAPRPLHASSSSRPTTLHGYTPRQIARSAGPAARFRSRAAR
ncbi:hypothetical protein ON010_g18898 [Phytophthora cinnamomi]|nr:hypothetical protein ON010_g18898 [Phytophthora cinnamomi]